jgi:AAA+ ATPase superfamily predicted ATPase
MTTGIHNPFVTSGYISPRYFCNRQAETSKLTKAISSIRNVTLISLRRMGKTGLLKHVKFLIEKDKTAPPVIYADLMPTMTGSEMLNTLSSALLRIKHNEKNFFEKILTLLASLRPRLTYDGLTGQPTVELKVETPDEIQYGLEHLLQFISGIKNNLVIMLDEFQQISNYPEKNIEQILRSVIQANPKIPFIFSGSNKHMLEAMFATASRPFYQSTEMMYLDSIEVNDYKQFIQYNFEAAGRKITEESILKIFEWTRVHTYYVQHICNKLFETDKKNIDLKILKDIIYQIISSNEPMYANYRNLLPDHQFRLLKALAVEGTVLKPTAGSFIQQHNLTSASSVSASLKALSDKEMIVRSASGWQVYDVFFSRWLAYHYGSKG